MSRRAVLALVALVLSTTVVGSPAQAAEDCKVSVPSKISIRSPYTELTVKFSGACTKNGYGAWEVVHPTQGPVDIMIFDADAYLYNSTTQKMAIYDWEPRGTWKVNPAGAFNWSTYKDLQQNATSTRVKIGTRVSLSSSRSGNYVTLAAKPQHYSPDTNAYRPSARTDVAFYSQKSDGTWQWRKTVSASSKGVATLKIHSPASKKWKAVIAETSGRWAATSAVTTR